MGSGLEVNPVTSEIDFSRTKIRPYNYIPVTISGRICASTLERISEPPGEHRCAECPAVFAKSGSLTKHIARSHHKNLTARCPECFKMLSAKAAIKKHLLSHRPRSQWPYQCPFCLKRFQAKADLPKHFMTSIHKNDPRIPEYLSPEWIELFKNCKVPPQNDSEDIQMLENSPPYDVKDHTLLPSSNGGRIERISNSHSFPLVPKNEPTESAASAQQNIRCVPKLPGPSVTITHVASNTEVNIPVSGDGNTPKGKATLTLVPQERLLSNYQQSINKSENQQVFTPPFQNSVSSGTYGPRHQGLPKLIRSNTALKPPSVVSQQNNAPPLAFFPRRQAPGGPYWNSNQGNSPGYSMGHSAATSLNGSGSGNTFYSHHSRITPSGFGYGHQSFPNQMANGKPIQFAQSFNPHQPGPNNYFQHQGHTNHQNHVTPPFAKPSWMTDQVPGQSFHTNLDSSYNLENVKQEVITPPGDFMTTLTNTRPTTQTGLDVFQPLSNIVKQEPTYPGQPDFSDSSFLGAGTSNPFQYPYKGIIKIEIEDTLF